MSAARRAVRVEDAAPAGPHERVGPALLLAVFGVALALRLVVAFEVSGFPYHRHLVLDAATYHRIALAGDPHEPYWQPPFYPWFLRAVYALAGPSPVAARLVQSVAGALVAAGVVLLARRFAPRRWAVGAGLAAALLGPLIVADVELLPGSLAALFVTWWTLGMLAWTGGGQGGLRSLRSLDPPLRRHDPPLRRFRLLALGIALGVAGLLVPTLALAGGLALLWLVRRGGWRPALAIGALALVPVAAVTVRNLQYQPGLVPVSYNGGINLWIGNNAAYPQSVGIRPGLAWTRLVQRPQCEGGAVTRAAESAWFGAEARAFARHEPLTFVRNAAWKAAAALSIREIGRNRDDYAVRDESFVMRLLLWPGFPGIVLLPLAVAGAFVMFRDESGALLVLVAAGVLASSVIFFPTARYRVPALPLLVVLAACGLARVRGLGTRDRAFTATTALAALALGLLPHGIPPIPAAETFYEIAIDLDQDGRLAEALPFYERALALAPDHVDSPVALGLALGKLDRQEEGRAHLERATQIDPGADTAWQGLGIYWMRQHDAARGSAAFEKAVQGGPCNKRAAAMLALALMEQGRLGEARARLEEANRRFRRNDPEFAKAWARLEQLSGH